MPTYSTVGPSSLHLDIWLVIIDIIAESDDFVANLRAVSLVCVDLVERCHAHIFRAIIVCDILFDSTVRDAHCCAEPDYRAAKISPANFIRLSQSARRSATLTRRFTICDITGWVDSTQFGVIGRRPSWSDPLASYVHLLTPLRSWGSNPRITHCALHNGPAHAYPADLVVELLHQFPSLTHVSMSARLPSLELVRPQRHVSYDESRQRRIHFDFTNPYGRSCGTSASELIMPWLVERPQLVASVTEYEHWDDEASLLPSVFDALCQGLLIRMYDAYWGSATSELFTRGLDTLSRPVSVSSTCLGCCAQQIPEISLS